MFGILQSGAQPIRDPDIAHMIANIGMDEAASGMYDRDFISTFMDAYDAWIRSSKHNAIRGLDSYDRFMCFAVTHAIEQYLMKHRSKRIRTFKGEYPGTMELIRGYGLDHEYLDGSIPNYGDTVIISAPFSGTGNMHPDMSAVLDRCDELRIPVMLDCAFYGICQNLRLNLNSSIETVAFSLSKCYSLQNHRIGMIYSIDPPVGISLLQRFGYTSRFGASLALYLFDAYGPDHAVDRYGPVQKHVCDALGGLEPSDTVIFGNGDSRWSIFDRGGSCNRVSLADFITSPELLSVVK